MIKVLLLFFLISYFPKAAAHDSEVLMQEHRVLKVIQVNQKVKAYVVVREDGHLLGQPYQVELRVRCEQNKDEILQLPIKNSFSVCDLSPQSLKLNQKRNAVAMKVKMADLNNYYHQLEAGLISPQINCAIPTQIKKFSLNALCDHLESKL